MKAISQEGQGYARKSTTGGTKMIQKLKDTIYEMRLQECGLTTLMTKRQIEIYMIMIGYENIDRNICS